MKTIKNIAVSAYLSSAGALFGLIFLAGCSALPAPPTRPVLYDFGPGTLAPAPADRRAPLPPLALAEVDAPGLPEGSTAVLYRLQYTDAQQLRPYSLARWSQPPAHLVQQRLREHLGQRRAILPADTAAAQARDPAQGNRLPPVLRVELEEFSQVFDSPERSVGLVRLRATLTRPGSLGESLLAQRLFEAQAPAPSPDATGGTRALAQGADQVAAALAQWLEASGY